MGYFLARTVHDHKLRLYTQVADEIGQTLNWDDCQKTSFMCEMAKDIRKGKLRVSNPTTGLLVEVTKDSDDIALYVTKIEVNNWLLKRRAPYEWDPVLIEAPIETLRNIKPGLTKKQILKHLWPLEGKFTNESLGDAMSNIPKWLLPARISQGLAGKNGTATWNPALMSIALIERGHTNKNKLNLFLLKNFPDWISEWEQYEEYSA